MEDKTLLVMSLVVFLPTLGALALVFMPRAAEEGMRRLSLLVTGGVFLLTVWMALPGYAPWQFSLDESKVSQMQAVFNYDWIRPFNIRYAMGMDGISFPLVLLTSFISLLAMGASWGIKKYVKAYCILFLLLETGMLGVFFALDFFLFFVFWEVMLLSMYFLIGVWGGPRKEYAAIKFFLYTMVGGVLMLIAILLLYFNSNLHKLDAKQLVAAHVHATQDEAQKFLDEGKRKEAETRQPAMEHTFNILSLQQMGQHTSIFTEASKSFLGRNIGWWVFLLLLIGFIIKVPSVPLHTWLPDAHVEAPTPISMILAGVLLKMGGYGIIRICYPICPAAGYDLAWLVSGIGVVSMVYGAFAALAQTDFKRMVAYSSVSHMGYVVLGIGAWSAWSGTQYNSDFWKWGMNGAMFQMIAHGVSSAGMFFMVGVLYDRVHHRDLNKFGGIFGRMPSYAGLSIVIFFAGLGLPGLCGFIGEVLVVFGAWKYSMTLTIISAFVVILTASYILWAIQRVYLGAEYVGPHGEDLTPITPREWSIAVPLVILAILFGVYPQVVFRYMSPTVDREVNQLADWAERNRPGPTGSGQLGLDARESPRMVITENGN